MTTRSRPLAALELAFLLLVPIKLVIGLRQYSDLTLWDEASYLRSGANLLQEGLRAAYWGPLYSVWYFLLSRLCPDRVRLYYLSWQVLIVANALAAGWLLGRLGVRRGPRIAGVLLLVYGGYFFVTPHIHGLEILILLLTWTAALALSRRSAVAGLAAVQAGYVLASFVRPECFVGSLLYLPILAVLCVRQRTPARDVAAIVAALAIVYGGLILAFGVPFGGERLVPAFGQHYGMNLARTGRLGLDPWFDYDRLLQRDFGSARSILGMTLANPAAMTRHLLTNLERIPVETARLLPVYEGGNSLRSQFAVLAFQGVLSLAVALAIAWHALRARATLGKRFSAFRRRRAGQWLAVAPGLLPSAIGVVLIYPRQHYLVPLLVPALLGAILFWDEALVPERFAAWFERPGVLAALLAVGLLAFPNICGAPWPRRLPRTEAPHPVTAVVEFIRSRGLEQRFERIGVLEIDQGYGVFLSGRYTEVEADKRPDGQSFDDYMAAHQIRVAVVTPRLVQDIRWAHDPGFASFRADPGSRGFERTRLSADTEVFVAR